MEQNILALDLATSCGYAIYINDKVVKYGVENLCKRKEEHTRYYKLWEWLGKIIEEYQINKIVMEDVFVPKNEEKYKTYKACKVLFELRGVVKCVSVEYGIKEPIIINAMSAKNFMFTPTYKASQEMLKKGMIKAVEALGYKLPARNTDDIADAIGILCTYLNKKIQATP